MVTIPCLPNAWTGIFVFFVFFMFSFFLMFSTFLWLVSIEFATPQAISMTSNGFCKKWSSIVTEQGIKYVLVQQRKMLAFFNNFLVRYSVFFIHFLRKVFYFVFFWYLPFGLYSLLLCWLSCHLAKIPN